jgi:hypothetical protein
MAVFVSRHVYEVYACDPPMQFLIKIVGIKNFIAFLLTRTISMLTVYLSRILPAEQTATNKLQYSYQSIMILVTSLPFFKGPATGKYHGALITNDEAWEEAAVIAGRISGDLLHPLPYCPELHFSEFTSAVADMKNSVAVSFSPPSNPVMPSFTIHAQTKFE